MRSIEKWEDLLFNSWEMAQISSPFSSLRISAFTHTCGHDFKLGMTWNVWVTHKRFDPDHWTCDLRVWINSMDHIPWRCMDPGNGLGLWTMGPVQSMDQGLTVWEVAMCLESWSLDVSQYTKSHACANAGAGTLYRVLPKPLASCAPSSRYLHLWPQVVSRYHCQCQNQMHQGGFQANTFHSFPTLQLVAQRRLD